MLFSPPPRPALPAGVGKALAREFLRRGDQVVVTSRSQAAVDRTVEELRAEVPGMLCVCVSALRSCCSAPPLPQDPLEPKKNLFRASSRGKQFLLLVDASKSAQKHIFWPFNQKMNCTSHQKNSVQREGVLTRSPCSFNIVPPIGVSRMKCRM